MITFRPTSILLLTLVFSLAGCAPHVVREAQRVVAEADSLWQNGQMYGVDSGDSATLAQAYETLGAIPFPIREGLGLNNTFTRSCYHYGKLLRKKNNPVEAMQAFIRATHAHSRDYHYLGRIYTNMGIICHLAGEYNLSYDMYNCASEMFLKNGDTINYYYALNDMAFELAEVNDIAKVNDLLAYVEDSCNDVGVRNKILETRLFVLGKSNQYDSVILFVDSLSARNHIKSYLVLAKARSFFHKQIYDSAYLYAQRTLAMSNDLFDQDNAYYILIHCDSVYSNNNVYTLSAERADIEKEIEIRHGKHCQATQLLEQDLKRKPDLLWLYAVLLTLVLVGTGIVVYVQHKRKKRKLITQEIEILEQVTLEMQEKHNELSDSYLTDHQRIVDEINSRCSVLQTDESIKQKLAWRNYAKLCKIVDKQFYLLVTKLRDRHSLKETEIRICILTLLDCKNDMMAELLYKSPTSIGTMKRRVANKLGTTSINLRTYLIDNVCIK